MWPVVELGSVLPFKYGKSLPERVRNNTGSIDVVSSAGISGKHDETFLREPCVVIGRKGSIGTSYFCADPVWPIDTTFYVTGSDAIDLKFAYYLLQTLPFGKMNNDSAVPGLNRSHAEALEVAIPPLAEQRAIAATLGALDDKIESDRRSLQLCETLGDQLFLKNATELLPLSKVASLTMGSSPPGETYNDRGEGLAFFQGTRDFGFRFPKTRVWTTGPVRVASINSTLISVRAPVGDLNRARETCCIGRGVASAESHKTPSSLYYALRNSSESWEPFHSEGTVFGSINRRDLESLVIRWIPEELLGVVEEQLSALDNKIFALSQQIHKSTALRDALLPELLSGRIRVVDAA